ncbi:hypothetical protein [Dermatobacter hominis]|uniref:hypothetical protein n=1 Tax=Dermatobacter hominis TaxID=2884263 RepID=UPI001D0F6F3A|nr:hypothetical protein [Dermatobacter hominis]UDY33981.1 hypothetical protein LH044_11555 [Dermatobacter hominis]
MINLLAAIQFDPHIRGILVVLVGVGVLIGSVYLLLATNTGLRNGFLIAMAGLFGWMFSMGAIWWIYGIGLRGKDPSWVAKEINFSRSGEPINDVLEQLPRTEDLEDPQQLLSDYLADHPDVQEKIEATEGEGFKATTLTKAVTAAPALKAQVDEELNGWRILSETDSRRGEASASADATLIAAQAFGSETASSSYTVKDVFFFGGKPGAEPETVKGERSTISQVWHRVQTVFEPKNPPLYAAVTVQQNAAQVVAPGEAPPPAQINEQADTVTVLMERNLGYRRLPSALFTIFTGIIFAVSVWLLHRRDKRAMRERSEWDPSAQPPAVRDPETVG